MNILPRVASAVESSSSNSSSVNNSSSIRIKDVKERAGDATIDSFYNVTPHVMCEKGYHTDSDIEEDESVYSNSNRNSAYENLINSGKTAQCHYYLLLNVGTKFLEDYTTFRNGIDK